MASCYLYGHCPCQSGACGTPPDEGCPVYRYFKTLIRKESERMPKEITQEPDGIDYIPRQLVLDLIDSCFDQIPMEQTGEILQLRFKIRTMPAFCMEQTDADDLDIIHRIRSGKLKKAVKAEYAIYNGDWYRDHPWNIPKEEENEAP